MSFRKRKKSVTLSPPIQVFDFVSDSDDSPRSRVSLSPEEYLNKHPIPSQEFSLGEQIRANVPLKEINCSHLLDSNDNLDYSVNDTAEETILKALEDDSLKDDSLKDDSLKDNSLK